MESAVYKDSPSTFTLGRRVVPERTLTGARCFTVKSSSASFQREISKTVKTQMSEFTYSKQKVINTQSTINEYEKCPPFPTAHNKKS